MAAAACASVGFCAFGFRGKAADSCEMACGFEAGDDVKRAWRFLWWLCDTALLLIALPLIATFLISMGVLVVLGDIGAQVDRWSKE